MRGEVPTRGRPCHRDDLRRRRRALLRPHPPALAATPFRRSTSQVDNRGFRCCRGAAYVYRGVKDGRPSRDVVLVAHRTAAIDGVPCAVLAGSSNVHGRLAERTTEPLVQRRDRPGQRLVLRGGHRPLDARGKVTSAEGSWRAGADGARPGILMPAHPRVGQVGEPEYYSGRVRPGPLPSDRPVFGRSPAALGRTRWGPRSDSARTGRPSRPTSSTSAGSGPCSSRPRREGTSATRTIVSTHARVKAKPLRASSRSLRRGCGDANNHVECPNARARASRQRGQLLNKVPEVTLYFWVIKVLCTTVGETASTTSTDNVGPRASPTSTFITGALLIAALVFQFRAAATSRRSTGSRSC